MISVLGMAAAMVSCKPDEESLRGEAGFILDTTSRWTLADPDRLGILSGSYEVFNDTMIEGVRWRQIGRNSREGWVLDCLLRQEGEQVYRYDAASGEGLLVYDFDVAEGEQVTVYGLEGAETLTVALSLRVAPKRGLPGRVGGEHGVVADRVLFLWHIHPLGRVHIRQASGDTFVREPGIRVSD